jgi:hypothetical protein
MRRLSSKIAVWVVVALISAITVPFALAAPGDP